MKNLYILVFSSSVIHPIINKVFGGTNMKQIENMEINKLVGEMRVLNGSNMIFSVDLMGRKVILSMVEHNELVYPEGYYWSSKNGVTNKHNTASGQYESFDLYEMKLAQ